MELQLKKDRFYTWKHSSSRERQRAFLLLGRKTLCKRSKNTHINRTRGEATRNIKKMTWGHLESIVKCVQGREEMWWGISKNEKGGRFRANVTCMQNREKMWCIFGASSSKAFVFVSVRAPLETPGNSGSLWFFEKSRNECIFSYLNPPTSPHPL